MFIAGTKLRLKRKCELKKQAVHITLISRSDGLSSSTVEPFFCLPLATSDAHVHPLEGSE